VRRRYRPLTPRRWRCRTCGCSRRAGALRTASAHPTLKDATLAGQCTRPNNARVHKRLVGVSEAHPLTAALFFFEGAHLCLMLLADQAQFGIAAAGVRLPPRRFLVLNGLH